MWRHNPHQAALTRRRLYAYCERIEVNERERFVLHHVELDKGPNLVGRTRKRWFGLSCMEGPHRVAETRAARQPYIAYSGGRAPAPVSGNN